MYGPKYLLVQAGRVTYGKFSAGHVDGPPEGWCGGTGPPDLLRCTLGPRKWRWRFTRGATHLISCCGHADGGGRPVGTPPVWALLVWPH